MAAEKKVFDVGKPGSEKPQTGSKPMVIGHKTLLADPTLKDESKEPEVESNDEAVKKTEKSKIELKPISASEKQEVKTENTNEQPPAESVDEAKPDEANPSKAEESTVTDEEPDPEQVKQDKQKEEAGLEVERSERLEAMVKSKEYFVPIKESSKTAIRTFVTTVAVVILVGIAITALLIDAEILDLGINLPFDFL